MEKILITDKEIILKAIKRARKQNYKLFSKHLPIDFYIEKVEYPYIIDRDRDLGDDIRHIYEIIFSHDFAKAFWGEKAEEAQIMKYSDFSCNERGIPRWKYHLQQMVLEEEPLKYLEKFL
jgi:hypothetical protein